MNVVENENNFSLFKFQDIRRKFLRKYYCQYSNIQKFINMMTYQYAKNIKFRKRSVLCQQGKRYINSMNCILYWIYKFCTKNQPFITCYVLHAFLRRNANCMSRNIKMMMMIPKAFLLMFLCASGKFDRYAVLHLSAISRLLISL